MGLKLHNRRWYPLVCLIGSAAVIAAWWRLAADHQPELLLSAVAGVAGVTYFLYRQHLDETKLFKELFAEFNARYDALNDELNMILVGPPKELIVCTAGGKNLIFSYFQPYCGRVFLLYGRLY